MCFAVVYTHNLWHTNMRLRSMKSHLEPGRRHPYLLKRGVMQSRKIPLMPSLREEWSSPIFSSSLATEEKEEEEEKEEIDDGDQYPLSKTAFIIMLICLAARLLALI